MWEHPKRRRTMSGLFSRSSSQTRGFRTCWIVTSLFGPNRRSFSRSTCTVPLNTTFISYGGHYGPTFAACVITFIFSLGACLITSPRYFLSQNAAIAAGTISGLTLNLKVLGVGDGLTVGRHVLKTLSPDKGFKGSFIPIPRIYLICSF